MFEPVSRFNHAAKSTRSNTQGNTEATQNPSGASRRSWPTACQVDHDTKSKNGARCSLKGLTNNLLSGCSISSTTRVMSSPSKVGCRIRAMTGLKAIQRAINTGAHHVYSPLNTRLKTNVGRPSIAKSPFPGRSQNVKPTPGRSLAPNTLVHVDTDSRIDLPDDGPLSIELRAVVGKRVYTRDSAVNQGEMWHAVGSAELGEPASDRSGLLTGPVIRIFRPQLSENGSVRIDCYQAIVQGVIS